MRDSQAAGDTPIRELPPVPEQPEFTIDRVDSVRHVIDHDVLLQLVTDGVAGRFAVTRDANGYAIDSDVSGTVLERLGIAAGDVIATVDNVAVDRPEMISWAYSRMRAHGSIHVELVRNGRRIRRKLYFLDPGDRNMATMPAQRQRAARSRRLSDVDVALHSTLAAGVNARLDHNYDIDRAVLQALGNTPAYLTGQRVAHDTVVRGLRVTEPGGFYEHIGLTPYDVVQTVGDIDLIVPADLAEQMIAQRSVDGFKIAINRFGDRITLDYRVVTGLVDADAVTTALAAWSQEKAAQQQMLDALLARSRDESSAPAAEQLVQWIKPVEAGVYEVRADKLEDILSASPEARIVPSMRNGRFLGFKFYTIRPSSVIAKLGIRNGDTVHSVNGVRLKSPETALDVYSKLGQAQRVEVGLTRRGKPMTLTYILNK